MPAKSQPPRPGPRGPATTNRPKNLTAGQKQTTKRSDFGGQYSNPGGVPVIKPGQNFRTPANKGATTAARTRKKPV